MQCTLLPGPWPAIVSSAWPSARDWQQATMVGPGPWQPVTRLRETRSLWYRVDLPPATQLDPAARHVALTIPSFYASAEVYLDDELVAASDLPYLPLRVDVSRLLATPSAHELLIRIGACFAGDEELDETLHGKQDWYTPAVGNFGPLVLTQSRLPLPEPHWATTLPSATEGLLLAPELSTFDGQISGWLEAPDGSIEPVQLLGGSWRLAYSPATALVARYPTSLYRASRL